MEFVRSQFTPVPLPEQDFTGQTIIVTGASSGLGLEAARHFVRLNASSVILAIRNVAKASECKAAVELGHPGSKTAVDVWELDLTKADTIRRFSEKAQGLARLDAVILNAGMGTMTFGAVDGVERTIATNVTGTFLFALGVLPALRESAKRWSGRPRLVLVSSLGHAAAGFPEKTATDIFEALNDAGKTDMTDRYDTSKLIQLLAFFALRRAVDKTQPNLITLTAVDPGMCDTRLAREFPLWFRVIHRAVKFVLARSAEMGSRTIVHGAVDAGMKLHGAYMCDGAKSSPSPTVTNAEGVELQDRVFSQLVDVLSRVDRDIVSNGLMLAANGEGDTGN